MISSMTGFARVQAEQEWGSLVWEIRSVNHRYLDLNWRIPESLRELEMPLREFARQQLKRGKLDCSLRYQISTQASQALQLNQTLLAQVAQLRDQVAKQFPQAGNDNIVDILRWPDMLIQPETDMDPIKTAATEAFQAALIQLDDNRQREGSSIADFMQERLVAMREQVSIVEKFVPTIMQEQRQKLLDRISELDIEINQDRLEQELVFLAQKLDVAEELDRLQTHIKEVENILKSNEAIGRRLDFLMQELNREANTLGSKSSTTQVTKAAVELKVIIEQMREQVQNIE